MPLSKSCKKVGKNIETLVKEGRGRRQAVAIALSTARKSGCAVKKAPKKGGKTGRAAPCGCSKAGRASPDGRFEKGDRVQTKLGRGPGTVLRADYHHAWVHFDGDNVKVKVRFTHSDLQSASKAGRAGGRGGRTTHWLKKLGDKHVACGERAYADTARGSIKDASCYYCKLAWEKDQSKGRATPMRERSPIQIGKSVGGYRFDDHRHTTRQKVGLLMQQWHSSMGDPIYAVGSYYFANVVYPDADVVRRAHSALKRDLDHAKAGQHGWGRNEVLQLGTILAYLDWALDHDYSTGEAKGAGSATHFNDPFGYHSEVQFLVEHAGFHRDDVIEFTNRDSATNIIDEQRKKHRTPSHAAAWMIAEMRKAGYKNRESGEAKGAGRAMGIHGRYSKTKNERVGRALEKVLARYGTKVGMFVDKYPVFEFDTSAGKLRGYITADGQTNNVWFMSRFDVPSRAAKVLHDVNPHSGKWNHHFPNADADAAATHLTRLLARVDVVGEPGRAYGYAKGRTKKRAAKKRGRAGRASGS